MSAAPDIEALPFSHIERDLCRKAADDVNATVRRTLSVCEGDAQCAVVAIHAAMMAMGMAAAAMRKQWPDAMASMSDHDLMRAVVAMIEQAAQAGRARA